MGRQSWRREKGVGSSILLESFSYKMLFLLHLIREKEGNEGTDRGNKRQRRRREARRKRGKIFLYS